MVESETKGTVVAAIPARYASSRLPGKPLLLIGGRPMIQHVYERARQVELFARVVVLTDDERIQRAVEAFGGECQLTPAECASGSDRIAWVARSWSESAIVNIQGDEPLIDPRLVASVAEHLVAHPADDIVTLASPAADEDIDNPNAVKVVLDRQGYALYFSRSPIPYRRVATQDPMLRHVGLYGYQRSALLRLASLPPSPLEQAESLEQLRALENGLRLRVLTVGSAAPGVDTAEDLERVRARFES